MFVSKWKALMTPKVGVLFIIGIIVVFGIKDYLSKNDELSYELVAPVEQSDGTIHYTLYHYNGAQKPPVYEPWIVALPEVLYVYRPESLNDTAKDIGVVKVNDVSVNLGSLPNQKLSIFMTSPDLGFLSQKPERSFVHMVSDGELIRISLNGTLDLQPLPNFMEFGCVIDYELSPFLYKLRDARDGEIPENIGKYTYAGKRGCFGENNDDYYAFKSSERSDFTYFKCNENKNCSVRVIFNKMHLRINFNHGNLKYIKEINNKLEIILNSGTVQFPSNMEVKVK